MIIYPVKDVINSDIDNEQISLVPSDLRFTSVNKKEFYMKGKSLFLTYSRIPEHWTKEYVRDELMKKLTYERKGSENGKSKIISYVIAFEDHKEPIGTGEYIREKHVHCYLLLDRITSIRGASFLDILENSNNDCDINCDELCSVHLKIHGKYEVVRNRKRTLNYVKKHGDYIEDNVHKIVMNESNASLIEARTELDFKNMMFNQMPYKEKLEHWKQMKKCNDELMEVECIRKRTDEITMKYKFHRDMRPLYNGKGVINYSNRKICGMNNEEMPEHNTGREKCFIFYGPVETGKSMFVKGMAFELGYQIFTIKGDIRVMNSYTNQEIIFFDECKKADFHDLQDDIALMITSDDYCPPAYCGSKNIRTLKKVIIATNENPRCWFFSEAMKSRSVLISCTENPEKYQMEVFNKNGTLIPVQLLFK